MQIDQEKIQEAIVVAAVDDIFRDWSPIKDVLKKVDDRIDKLFAEQASATIRAAIDTAIADGVDREYVRVDSWGRPQGEKTSIRQELEASITDYWNQRVDSAGKPTASTYNATTRAQYLLIQAAGEDFHKLVKQNAISVTAALKDGLRGQLRSFVDQSLGELFRVQSHEDQAEGRTNG